jgi:signal transduction histidine kinase
MRLSEVLIERKEEILQEFEDFARTHTTPGLSMDVEALRDHAASILDAMALDLEQPQTVAEQERKGKGDALATAGAPRTAAEHHGIGRAQSGFSMAETFAEYRALRASVMRYYVAARSGPDSPDVQDVIRFNEAIDQALAESITEYARAVNRYRDMFLAVLGHDLRSPLNAILNASTFLTEFGPASGREHHLATTIAGSAKTMTALIEDLLEYTSEELGQGITLRRSRVDLGELARDIVREAELVRPRREIRLSIRGEVVGEWDAGRVRQALSNLVNNALRHAPEQSTVTVAVSCEPAGDVVGTVHNSGPVIPEHERELIFQPFRRAAPGGGGQVENGGKLGLGLYIARRMAEAHGGTVDVDSSAQAGTTFSLRLPRRSSDTPGA